MVCRIQSVKGPGITIMAPVCVCVCVTIGLNLLFLDKLLFLNKCEQIKRHTLNALRSRNRDSYILMDPGMHFIHKVKGSFSHDGGVL